MFQPAIREEIGRLRVEEGRSVRSLSEEFGVSLGSVSRWTREYQSSGGQAQHKASLQDIKRENERLTEENERLRAEAERSRIEADVLRDLIRSMASSHNPTDEPTASSIPTKSD